MIQPLSWPVDTPLVLITRSLHFVFYLPADDQPDGPRAAVVGRDVLFELIGVPGPCLFGQRAG
ncbi:MAG: hypothetical protein ACXWZY_11630 [Gaiellaceae bacterium]